MSQFTPNLSGRVGDGGDRPVPVFATVVPGSTLILSISAREQENRKECAFTRNLIVLNWRGCPQTVERDDKCGIVQDG